MTETRFKRSGAIPRKRICGTKGWETSAVMVKKEKDRFREKKHP